MISEEAVMKKILHRLEDGDYSAKFIGFSFTGGENLDTNMTIDINTESGRVGKMCLGNGSSYRISFNPMSGVMAGDGFQTNLEQTEENKELFNTVRSGLIKALERDDPEVIKGVTINGNRYMPDKSEFYANLTDENSKFNGYGEISRSDITSGKFIERVKKTPEYEEHKSNVFTYEEEPEEDYEL